MCVLLFHCALPVLICWVSVSKSNLMALFFPQVAEDAPANAVLFLLSFWGKPPASVDQMERELQSHSDAETRFFPLGPRTASMAVSVLHRLAITEVSDLGRKPLRMILFWGCFSFNCYVSVLNRPWCLYSRETPMLQVNGLFCRQGASATSSRIRPELGEMAKLN